MLLTYMLLMRYLYLRFALVSSLNSVSQQTNHVTSVKSPNQQVVYNPVMYIIPESFTSLTYLFNNAVCSRINITIGSTTNLWFVFCCVEMAKTVNSPI